MSTDIDLDNILDFVLDLEQNSNANNEHCINSVAKNESTSATGSQHASTSRIKLGE